MVVAACQDLPLICIGNCNLRDYHLQDITAPTFSSARSPQTQTHTQTQKHTHTRPGTAALLQARRIALSPSSSLHDHHCPKHFGICCILSRSKTVRNSRRTAYRSCPKQCGSPCTSISASSPPTTTSECRCPTDRSNTPQISARHNRRCYCRHSHSHRHRRPRPRPLLISCSPVCLTLYLSRGRRVCTPTAHATSRTEKAFEAVSAAASLSQRLHTPIHQTRNHLNRPP